MNYLVYWCKWLAHLALNQEITVRSCNRPSLNKIKCVFDFIRKMYSKYKNINILSTIWTFVMFANKFPFT